MTHMLRTTPFGRAPKTGESWWYLGCLVTSLATASETGGQLSAVEAVIRKGVEPPPHIHNNEDEAYYITKGRFSFHVGEAVIDASEGTFVWLPRGVVHSWEVDQDGATALIVTTPGGFLEAMFAPFSEPATTLALPPIPENPPLQDITDLDLRLGVEYPEAPASSIRAQPQNI